MCNKRCPRPPVQFDDPNNDIYSSLANGSAEAVGSRTWNLSAVGYVLQSRLLLEWRSGCIVKVRMTSQPGLSEGSNGSALLCRIFDKLTGFLGRGVTIEIEWRFLAGASVNSG